MKKLVLSLSCLTPLITFSQTNQLDLNNDGFSDVWTAFYGAQGLSPTADTDGDGTNNRDESIAGTDPFSALSVLRIQSLSIQNDQCSLSWNAVPGKRYTIQSSSDLSDWKPTGITVNNAAGLVSRSILADGIHQFFRISVSDQDVDRDGLSSWEESLLGFSDTNANSNASSRGGDFPAAVALFGSSQSFSLDGKTVQGTRPSLPEASRFLQQATMGADYEMIQSVAASGVASWIEDQFSKPVTSHVTTNNALSVFDTELNSDLSNYIWTWWDAGLRGEDVLRQRVAFALSEILVIGQTTDELEDHFWGIATYYDILVKNAFGNYRDILYQVSTNPAMGHYLSHVKNRPTDPLQNLFPDENYAREVMQLFSIGLFELHQDGSRKKDINGNDIPTYDNSDITEFARVFTGLTYNPVNPNNGTPYENEEGFTGILSTGDYLGASSLWMGIEMAQYEPMHETGVKQLLRGESTNGTLREDLNAAIDNLFNHPNTGPFIGRLLIQRLVKSNPSPGYIYRVAAAFNNNGSGVRGDMKAVIRAILLDPEARNRSFLDDPTHGKLREPVIRHMHLMRAFNISSSTGRFRNDHFDAFAAYAQRPMRANSVFNFYLPDHQPLGAIKARNLVAPEFQITTATTTIKTLNLWSFSLPFDNLVTFDEDISPGAEQMMDYSDEVALAGDIDALLDRLDLILTRGQMAPATRTVIKNALIAASSTTESEDLVRFAVSLIASSADFAVLR